MRVSEDDLKSLKNLSESMVDANFNGHVSSRASAYLAIETIHQLNKNTRNNILFTLLGATLGFLGSIGNTLISQNNDRKEVQEEFQQLNKQLLEVKKKLSSFQTYYSKRDSLQIFSKKE